MGQGNKKVWLCLLAVILTAVVVGAVYYYNSAERKNSSEGVDVYKRQRQDGFSMEETLL